MSNLETAISIAAKAHAGQTDKAGEPYILHPIRVMLGVESMEEKMAAVLHDTVEDTDITFEDLDAAGFSAKVVDALRALTKNDGESRLDAAKRAVVIPIARRVKLADVADNMNLDRIPDPTTDDYRRLEEYEFVRELLAEPSGS